MADFIAVKRPGTVWVTKTDSNVLTIQSPQVIADTLSGFVHGNFLEMPLTIVQSMRARQAAPRRTLLLVGGLTLALGSGVYYYLERGAGQDPNYLGCIPNSIVEGTRC